MRARRASVADIIALALAVVIVGYGAVRATDASQAANATQQLLCIGIMDNEMNTARDNPKVIELCEEVGVRP